MENDSSGRWNREISRRYWGMKLRPIINSDLIDGQADEFQVENRNCGRKLAVIRRRKQTEMSPESKFLGNLR